jgi:cell division protein FtsZ
VPVLIAASKNTFKLAEDHNAINTIRRYAADEAHVIDGTACDDALGDPLRVSVIATGLSSVTRKAAATPPLSVVQHAQPQLRTGTDNIPVMNQVAQPGHAGHPTTTMGGGAAGGTTTVQAPQPHSCDGLNTPSVWRTHRTHAAAKVDALASNGMEEIEIPAFLRKQAD